jgi:hypothetical protein
MLSFANGCAARTVAPARYAAPLGTNQIGIPASGVLTGQDCCKTQEEVDLFGGQLGNYEGNLGTFDGGCVDNPFRWCDNLDNNDPKVMTFMSRAFANMVVQMAFDTKVMSSSDNTSTTSTSQTAAQTSRRFAAK